MKNKIKFNLAYSDYINLKITKMPQKNAICDAHQLKNILLYSFGLMLHIVHLYNELCSKLNKQSKIAKLVMTCCQKLMQIEPMTKTYKLQYCSSQKNAASSKSNVISCVYVNGWFLIICLHSKCFLVIKKLMNYEFISAYYY